MNESRVTPGGSVSISGTLRYGDELTANVTNTDNATLSYQWYSNTTNSTTGGIAISGATSATFTPTEEQLAAAANKASADDYMKANFPEWKITGLLNFAISRKTFMHFSSYT